MVNFGGGRGEVVCRGGEGKWKEKEKEWEEIFFLGGRGGVKVLCLVTIIDESSIGNGINETNRFVNTITNRNFIWL